MTNPLRPTVVAAELLMASLAAKAVASEDAHSR